jgi:hypothetical protein
VTTANEDGLANVGDVGSESVESREINSHLSICRLFEVDDAVSVAAHPLYLARRGWTVKNFF